MRTNEYFAEIYDQYQKPIYKFINSKVQNEQIAEDLTSDVFLAVYKNLDRYDSNRSFITTWLYTIASNRLKNYYKSRSRIEQSMENIDEKNAMTDNPIEREELRMIMECFLEQIPERNRKIVIMKYYSNMTSGEIGRQLGISSGNVRIILKRTLTILRNMMK